VQNVVGVRFKKAGKIYYFDPGEAIINRGDAVIVETARGVEYGEVVVGPKSVPDEEVVAPLKKVLRVATESDVAEMADNRRREQEAIAICARKVAEHGLEMNLIDCEYTFDGSKIIFYFTAEGRVDFRELVRDLAATFRTRIELRQIGVRDEAKMLGGLGPCGRPICCASFLGDFAPVSIKMAKEQNLSLNPSKISGLCGRLMCCLRYESDHYVETRASLPEVGSTVITPEGEGRVIAQNLLRNTVSVELASKVVIEFPLEEVDREEDARDNKAVGVATVRDEIGEEGPSKPMEGPKVGADAEGREDSGHAGSGREGGAGSPSEAREERRNGRPRDRHGDEHRGNRRHDRHEQHREERQQGRPDERRNGQSSEGRREGPREERAHRPREDRGPRRDGMSGQGGQRGQG